MKRNVFLLICFMVYVLLFVLLSGKEVHALSGESGMENTEEYEDIVDRYYNQFDDSIDMKKLESELNAIHSRYGEGTKLSFSEIYHLLLEGNVETAVSNTIDLFCKDITGEIMENRNLLARMIVLVIIAAIFNNYSSVLKVSYVGEQGFYITYLLIAVLLIQSFTLVYDLAEETVLYLKEIMECMLPAFYMSVMLCSGLVTSQMVNSLFVWMLSLVEKMLLCVVLPATRIYFLIILLNQVNTKDRFSKLAGLIKQGTQWMLKAIVTGIIGLNIMKSMLVPVYENAKYNVLQKGLSVIPGGTSISGLSTILLGAGVLIKNTVGITVVIILLALGGIPLLKILSFYIVYRLLLALIQPISDKRILMGIQGAADSAGLLLRATATSIILSLLSIAIVILSTNVRLYTG